MEATFLRQSELDYILQKVMLLLGDDIKVTVRDLKVESKTGKLITIFYATKVRNKQKFREIEIILNGAYNFRKTIKKR